MAQSLLGSEMLARIIDGSPIPSFVIDSEHEVAHWNTALEALSGMKKEEIIGTDEQWKAFYAEKRQVMADLIIDGASPDEIEAYYGDKCRKSNLIDGAFEAEDFFPALGTNGKWLRFTASPIKGDSGNTVGAIETLEDVTERRSAEEMLAPIVDGSPNPTFVIDGEHKVTHWNTAMEALSGIRMEDVVGTDEHWRAFYAEKRPVIADLIVDGVPEEDMKPYYGDMLKKSCLIDGAYQGEGFFSALGAKGKWLHSTASPIRNRCGIPIGAIETLRDITEHKVAEDNLRYYLQQITRAQEEERKRIARDLHDDTAQVLGSLSRQLDNFIRKKSGLAPSEILFLKDLQVQLNRGVQSVHSFGQALRLSVLDDFGLIAALRSLVKELRDTDGVSTDVKVLGAERRLAPECELLVFRIVQEALNNIRKHAQATQADVTIEFGQDEVKVTVIDNGRGFELSGRIDNLPRSGKLGLAGMLERARLLGGTIQIDSAPGQGTTLVLQASC